MNIQAQSNINFQAKISKQVLQEVSSEKIYNRYKSPAKTAKAVKEKLKDIETWGSPYSELVITKNFYGKDCLGLMHKLNNTKDEIWEIRGLSGRNILTNILNLHESHIISTENSIRYLLRKYGKKIFNTLQKADN